MGDRPSAIEPMGPMGPMTPMPFGVSRGMSGAPGHPPFIFGTQDQSFGTLEQAGRWHATFVAMVAALAR